MKMTFKIIGVGTVYNNSVSYISCDTLLSGILYIVGIIFLNRKLSTI